MTVSKVKGVISDKPTENNNRTLQHPSALWKVF